MFIFFRKTLHRYLLEQYLIKNKIFLVGSILDVGAGAKRYNHLCNGNITSIDINPNGEVLFGDVTNLSFENNIFDTVICVEVLEYVSDYGKALDEILRVLKSDGHLILTVPFFYQDHGDLVRFTKSKMEDMIKHRFKDFSVLTFGNRYVASWDMYRNQINKNKNNIIKFIFFIISQPYFFWIFLHKSLKDSMYTGIFVIAKK